MESNTMQMSTLADAQTFVENSGVADWEWGGSSSAEGFAAYLYLNYSNVDRNDYNTELAAYLTSCGENPQDYL